MSSFSTTRASRQETRGRNTGRTSSAMTAKPGAHLAGDQLYQERSSTTRKRKHTIKLGDPEAIGLVIVGQQDHDSNEPTNPEGTTPPLGMLSLLI